MAKIEKISFNYFVIQIFIGVVASIIGNIIFENVAFWIIAIATLFITGGMLLYNFLYGYFKKQNIGLVIENEVLRSRITNLVNLNNKGKTIFKTKDEEINHAAQKLSSRLKLPLDEAKQLIIDHYPEIKKNFPA